MVWPLERCGCRGTGRARCIIIVKHQHALRARGRCACRGVLPEHHTILPHKTTLSSCNSSSPRRRGLRFAIIIIIIIMPHSPMSPHTTRRPCAERFFFRHDCRPRPLCLSSISSSLPSSAVVVAGVVVVAHYGQLSHGHMLLNHRTLASYGIAPTTVLQLRTAAVSHDAAREAKSLARAAVRCQRTLLFRVVAFAAAALSAAVSPRGLACLCVATAPRCAAGIFSSCAFSARLAPTCLPPPPSFVRPSASRSVSRFRFDFFLPLLLSSSCCVGCCCCCCCCCCCLLVALPFSCCVLFLSFIFCLFCCCCCPQHDHCSSSPAASGP